MADAKSKSKGTVSSEAAQDQADTVEAVVETDPTEGGRVADSDQGVTTRGVGDDAVVVKLDEKIEGVFGDADTAETYVTLEKDVVEEFFYPNTTRPAYRTLFTKGQVVAQSTIDALNANVEARQAEKKRVEAGDEVPLEQYVDSTTLASGTGANVKG